MSHDPELESAFRIHERRVWAIAYRMTGSAADADDLVQDAFVKALATPPTGEVGPWLTRVAVNGGIDLLRERKRRGYVGPWLPEPIDTGDEHAEALDSVPSEERSASRRYDLLESASFAFLVALEALTPKARAVLLLCDVFDCSVREAASLLSMTETHVKVTHHRARRVLATYDATRTVPTRELQAQTRDALIALMSALVTGDVSAVSAMLADDVTTANDSDGRYLAARLPVTGRAKVALFWVNISRQEGADVALRVLNGLPALVVTLAAPPPGIAPRSAVFLSLDARGLVNRLHAVLAPEKLSRLFLAREEPQR